MMYLFDTCAEDPMGSGEIVRPDGCAFRHVSREMRVSFAGTGSSAADRYERKKFSGEDRRTMAFDAAIYIDGCCVLTGLEKKKGLSRDCSASTASLTPRA